MNKRNFLWMGWAILAALLLSFAACKDDDDEPDGPDGPATGIILANAEWTFGGEAGNYELMAATAGDWTVSPDVDWITLNKTSGNGNVTLGVTVKENNSGAQRTGVITVKDSDQKVMMTFKIIQEAIEEILKVTSEDTIRDIPATGKAIVIDVEANTDYSFDMLEWVKLAAAPSALGMKTPFAVTKSKITLNVDPNIDVDGRTTAVVIKQGNKEVKRVVLFQLGTAYTDSLTVDVEGLDEGTQIEIPALGGNLKLKVNSNADYLFSLTAWGGSTASLSAASDNLVGAEMMVMMEPNFTFGTRKRMLVVSGKGENAVNKTFNLVQKPVDIKVTTDTMAPALGGVGYLKVTCPEGVSYRYSANMPGIFYDNTLDKPEEHLLALKIESANTGDDMKEWQIMLEFAKGEFKNGIVYPQHLFPLVQAKIQPITIDWEGKPEDNYRMTVDSVDAAEVTVKVTAEGPCEYTADNWITVTEVQTTTSPYEYKLNFADNEANDKLRYGDVIFTMKGYDVRRSISVMQKKNPKPVVVEITGVRNGDKITMGWDKYVGEENANEAKYPKISPVDGELKAELISGGNDFGYLLTEASYTKGSYYLSVYNKAKNETGAVKTGKLKLTLTSGTEIRTVEIDLEQGFKPAAPAGITITDGGSYNVVMGGTYAIVGRPMMIYVAGSATGYKVVATSGMNIGWLTATTTSQGDGSANIVIMPWESGPNSVEIAIVPTDYDGNDFTNYPKFTITK